MMVKNDNGITVAIVTAREDADTTYSTWIDLRNAFLRGDGFWESQPGVKMPLSGGTKKLLMGEFGALLASCLNERAEITHVEYQLRALALQTRPPDNVVVVSRCPLLDSLPSYPFPVFWIEPMVSQKELEIAPVSCMQPCYMFPRGRNVSFGCADKNTAIIFSPDENLIMLDDCCLPGFGLVEASIKTCNLGGFLLLEHRQLYLPTREQPSLRHADANGGSEKIVLGILASPIEHLLAINGWNAGLMDGFRAGDDCELRIRLERYMKFSGLEYTNHPQAKVFEIEHSHPWNDDSKVVDWESNVPSGWWASGPSLREMRKSFHEMNNLQEIVDDQEAAAEEEGEDLDD